MVNPPPQDPAGMSAASNGRDNAARLLGNAKSISLFVRKRFANKVVESMKEHDPFWRFGVTTNSLGMVAGMSLCDLNGDLASFDVRMTLLSQLMDQVDFIVDSARNPTSSGRQATLLLSPGRELTVDGAPMHNAQSLVSEAWISNQRNAPNTPAPPAPSKPRYTTAARWKDKRLHDMLEELDIALGYKGHAAASRPKVEVRLDFKKGTYQLAVMIPSAKEYNLAREWCKKNQVNVCVDTLPEDGNIVELIQEASPQTMLRSLHTTMSITQELRQRWPDLRMESQEALQATADGVPTRYRYRFFTEMEVTEGDAFCRTVEGATYTLSVKQHESRTTKKSKTLVTDAYLDEFLSMDLRAAAVAAAAPPVTSPLDLVNAAVKKIEGKLTSLIDERQEAEKRYRSLEAEYAEAMSKMGTDPPHLMDVDGDDNPSQPLYPTAPAPVPGGLVCGLPLFTPDPADPQKRLNFIICAEKVIRELGDRVLKATKSDVARAEAITTAATHLPMDIFDVQPYLAKLRGMSSLKDMVALEQLPRGPSKRGRDDTSSDEVVVAPWLAAASRQIVPPGGHLDPALRNPSSTAPQPAPQKAARTPPANNSKVSNRKGTSNGRRK